MSAGAQGQHLRHLLGRRRDDRECRRKQDHLGQHRNDEGALVEVDRQSHEHDEYASQSGQIVQLVRLARVLNRGSGAGDQFELFG